MKYIRSGEESSTFRGGVVDVVIVSLCDLGVVVRSSIYGLRGLWWRDDVCVCNIHVHRHW